MRASSRGDRTCCFGPISDFSCGQLCRRFHGVFLYWDLACPASALPTPSGHTTTVNAIGAASAGPPKPYFSVFGPYLVFAESHNSTSLKRYLTAPPSFRNRGPLPCDRHFRSVRTDKSVIADTSCSPMQRSFLSCFGPMFLFSSLSVWRRKLLKPRNLRKGFRQTAETTGKKTYDYFLPAALRGSWIWSGVISFTDLWGRTLSELNRQTRSRILDSSKGRVRSPAARRAA